MKNYFIGICTFHFFIFLILTVSKIACGHHMRKAFGPPKK